MVSLTHQTTITVPSSTTGFYISALSLIPLSSHVAISWQQGSATHGITFVGPSSDYVIFDQVFGSPFASVQNCEDMPKEMSVVFQYGDEELESSSVVENDDMIGSLWKGWSVDEPEMKSCGPAGSSKKVLVKGYNAADVEKKQPMTVTVMFTCPMKGLKRRHERESK